MNITVNGTATTLTEPMTIADFLNQNGYADKLVAVAVNGTFVPRSAHDKTSLAANDTVEIVAPMQGG